MSVLVIKIKEEGNASLLKKFVKDIFGEKVIVLSDEEYRSSQKKATAPSRKRKKAKESLKESKNGNKPGFDFSWEGGLKELGNKYDGVKLQHHINSLRK